MRRLTLLLLALLPALAFAAVDTITVIQPQPTTITVTSTTQPTVTINTSGNDTLSLIVPGPQGPRGFRGYSGAQGSPVWGGITGDITSQSDLSTALGGKVATTGDSIIAGKLAIRSGAVALTVGADSNATTLTDATAKLGRIGSHHYNNAEKPVGLIYGNSSATENQVLIGGGSSSFNAATTMFFFTAPNATTPTGVEAMRINSNGTVGIGTTGDAKYALDLRKTLSSEVASGLYAQTTHNTGGLTNVFGADIRAYATHTTGVIANLTGTRVLARGQGTGGTINYLTALQTQADVSGGTPTILNSRGLLVSDMINGTTAVHGIKGEVSLATGGTNKWNLFVDGTAPNYLAGKTLIGSSAPTTGNEQLQVTGNANVTGAVTAASYRLPALNTAPSSATDTGTLGEIRVTGTYIYICTATNTWVRSALTMW